MKISTKKLRKLIQEELFYREFYGKAKPQRTIKNSRLSESAQRILHDDGKVKVMSSHEDNAGSYIEVYVSGLITASGDYSASSNEFQLDSSDAAGRSQRFYSLDQLVDFYKNSAR